ncbi:hypothetical protein SELMODRAFT_419667 [Selaginella moellendorffii]|uniref:Uncharacterized protein n=1 Tax=Selaginella moellendorffii TaxID=88036 RepID=D8S9N3_SELML|nr:hypothetical protein SELMODRAFT_419667 [Selaginella moellendorffii]
MEDFWTSCNASNAGNCRRIFMETFKTMYGLNKDQLELPTMPFGVWSVCCTYSNLTGYLVLGCSWTLSILSSTLTITIMETVLLQPHMAQHCYCCLLEVLVNVWAYHSARRLIYVDPETGIMMEQNALESRRRQMKVKWNKERLARMRSRYKQKSLGRYVKSPPEETEARRVLSTRIVVYDYQELWHQGLPISQLVRRLKETKGEFPPDPTRHRPLSPHRPLWPLGRPSIVLAMPLLLLLLPLRFLYNARSGRSFVIVYNMAYNTEIVLALVSLRATIVWLPQHHNYPKSNELVAMISFSSIVIAESSLFLCIHGCWEIISVRYKKAKKNRDRPRFLLETKSKFFVAVYETTLRDGAIKGLRMNLVDYVANEFLESRGNRELRKSLLMLDAVCHWEEEDQRKQSGKLLLASKRQVVERLFECMSHKYYLIYRRAAISLAAEICEDENAFLAVAHLVQASGEGVSLLVKALEPDTNKSVLELLGKVAAFGGIANAEPGVIANFDFARGDTHKEWKDSLRYTFNGDGDDPARVDVEPEIQISRQKIAANLRTLLRKNHDLTRYLANALFCSSQELQELALDARSDLLPGYKSLIYGLFHLLRTCQADPLRSKVAVVLDLLCCKNRQYLETLLDGSGSSSDDVIAVLMSALSFGLDNHDGERSKQCNILLFFFLNLPNLK